MPPTGVTSDFSTLAPCRMQQKRSPEMGSKNKGGREVRKPKKNAKTKAPVTSTVIPTTERPDNKPK
jgi:hypothetical protein